LILHGGPTWYKKNDWRLEWEQHPIQAYAAEGYCLVFPNVRGSADYGVEFRQANFRDLGGGDARDALAAVDHLIRQGFIDENKLGVAGWSYGGFLVPAIITQTDRFKAAQFGAGIPSFEAMYARLSTVEWIVHENYGKRPWEDAQAHIQDSPLYSAMKVKTPTLIEHGEDDPRCPVGGSILFYKALKFYGVPAVLEIYPKEGHGIVGPLLRRRCLRRNLEWFNKWLKGDRTTSFEKVFQP
jgi:prolyl oligopeptidase